MKKLSKKRIKKFIMKSMEEIPSIFTDEYYVSDIIKDFKKRHQLIWAEYIRSFHGELIIKESIFKFKTSEVYIYLSKREDESSYSIEIYFPEKNIDSIKFLISSIKEHKTI
jgi:hypothetical protein|tara:strand:+ start:468 stop:800 length:333 start_codon:yes stop_codon:yes gene_type:complete